MCNSVLVMHGFCITVADGYVISFTESQDMNYRYQYTDSYCKKINGKE